MIDSVELLWAQAKTNRLYFGKNIAQPDDDNPGVSGNERRSASGSRAAFAGLSAAGKPSKARVIVSKVLRHTRAARLAIWRGWGRSQRRIRSRPLFVHKRDRRGLWRYGHSQPGSFMIV